MIYTVLKRNVLVGAMLGLIVFGGSGLVAHGEELRSTMPDPTTRIRELTLKIAKDPFAPDVASDVTEILDLSYVFLANQKIRFDLLSQDYYHAQDAVSLLLKINPVRPEWHVTAVRASEATLDVHIYLHLLKQIVDAVSPFEYYETHYFTYRVDPGLLAHVGLSPPVVSGRELKFLKATTDRINQEPIQAQLLLEIARTYKSMGAMEDAAVYYDLYLKQYFPRWNSFKIMYEEHPRASNPPDPHSADWEQMILPSVPH